MPGCRMNPGKKPFSEENRRTIYYLLLTNGRIIAKILTMINIENIGKTPKEIGRIISANERSIRKKAKMSQDQLSAKSGVSLGSLKRFEQSGEISLYSLLKLAAALNCEDDFLQLFTKKQYHSIQEIIDEQI